MTFDAVYLMESSVEKYEGKFYFLTSAYPMKHETTIQIATIDEESKIFNKHCRWLKNYWWFQRKNCQKELLFALIIGGCEMKIK